MTSRVMTSRVMTSRVAGSRTGNMPTPHLKKRPYPQNHEHSTQQRHDGNDCQTMPTHLHSGRQAEASRHAPEQASSSPQNSNAGCDLHGGFPPMRIQRNNTTKKQWYSEHHWDELGWYFLGIPNHGCIRKTA